MAQFGSLYSLKFQFLITCYLLLLGMAGEPAFAQAQQMQVVSDIKVEGRFLQDSFQVGMPVQYSLTAIYPFELNIVFPDSGFSFSPFEYVERSYTPTKTIGGISKDSVVYTLMSFEMDSMLSLQMPVFWLHKGDTITVAGLSDKIYFAPLIAEDTLHTDVRSNVEFLEVAPSINYPFIFLFVALAVLLVLVVNYVFGKPIQRYIQLFLLKQRHSAFINTFEKMAQRIQKKAESDQMELLLSLWKNYIERLDKVPYTTFTTKEIGRKLNDKALIEALQAMDKWIYGGIEPENVFIGIERLRNLADNMYQQKRAELRNARKV